jgi:hypothetical protein
MLSRSVLSGLLAVIAVASAALCPVEAHDVPGAKNVVLVHGVYADGSPGSMSFPVCSARA